MIENIAEWEASNQQSRKIKGSFRPSPSPRKRPLIPKPRIQTLDISLSYPFLFSLYIPNPTKPLPLRNKNIDTHSSHQGLLFLIFSLLFPLLWLAFNNTTSSPPISCTLVHNHNKLLLSPLCFPSKPLMFKITLSTNNHQGPMPPLQLLLPLFIAKRVILLLPLTTTTRSPNSHQTLFLGCFGCPKMKMKIVRTLLELSFNSPLRESGLMTLVRSTTWIILDYMNHTVPLD